MAYTPTEWECGDIITAEKLNVVERGIAEMNAEYVPNEWACGDVITAERLNHMEQGIAEGCGGSSDFSTAEVTLINHSNNYFVGLEVVCVLNGEELDRSCSFGDPDDENVIEVVIYKNTASYASIQSGSGISAETTGDVRITSQVVDAYTFEITGNGTITIS